MIFDRRSVVVAILLIVSAAFALTWVISDVSPSPGVTVTGVAPGPYLVDATGAVGQAHLTTTIDVTPPAPGEPVPTAPPVITIAVDQVVKVVSIEFFAPGGEFDEFKLIDVTSGPGSLTFTYGSGDVTGFDPTVPYQVIVDLWFGNGTAGGSGDLPVPGGPGGGTALGTTSVSFALADGSVIAPEPATLALFGVGAAILAATVVRRRRNRQRP